MYSMYGYFAEFNRITKKIGEIASPDAACDRLFHLTNNCREPGNYELASCRANTVSFGKSHRLDINSVLHPQRVEISLSTRFGVRIVGAEKTRSGAYQYEVKEDKYSPKCHIANLAPCIGGDNATSERFP